MKPIPTINEIYARLEANLRSNLQLNDDDLRKVLDAMCTVLTGEIKLIYLFLADMQNNIYPDTADPAEDGGELQRLGNIYLKRQPRPATDGYYSIQVFGDSGSVIRPQLTFKSNDDSLNPGMLFITDTEYKLTGSNDYIVVRSIESGLSSSLDIGNQLTITEPVFGVEPTVEVEEIIELPVESEDIEIYRKAILDSIRLEPQGGAKTDYILWASDAQGVRTVYPQVKENEAGVIQIFVESSVVDSVDGHGTPTQFMIDNVIEVLNFSPDETIEVNERGRRPAQAILEVSAIEKLPVDVEILGLQQINQTIENSLKNNLEDYLYDIRPFIAGADLARNKNDILNVSRLSGVASDGLGNANYFTNFKMYVNGVEIPIYTFTGANIPYLRNLTITQ